MDEIQFFSNPVFGEIRVAGTADKPMFCLTDVCKSLDIKNVSDCKSRLNQHGVVITDTIDALGRKQPTTFVNEGNLYKCIFQSRKADAVQFQDWVTDEVLPSIRKTGGYMVSKQDDTPELIMARALKVAENTINRHKQQLEQANVRITLQDAQLKEQAPKVKYVDNVLQSANTYTTTQMSKELGLREAEQLHKLLKDRGVMFKQSGQWLLTAKYSELGYTKPRTHQYTRSDGTIGTNTVTVWTEKGRQFLHELRDNGEL